MTTGLLARPRKVRFKATKSDGGDVLADQEQQAPKTGGLRRRMLLIASSKGGSGKTASTINLAVQAAHAGLRVATVDLDRQETLTRWAKRRPVEGVPAIEHFTIPIPQIRAGLD